MRTWFYTIIFVLMITSVSFSLIGRSSYRVSDPQDPVVRTWYSDKPEEIYTYCESHFEEIIFKLYDQKHFQEHLLPEAPICFRYNCERATTGATLSALIQEAVNEIITLPPYQVPQLTSFTILKMRDINARDHTGVYILKFKNFPWVVKLFIELPSGFFRIGDKGFEPLCFYYMGGGINRHLTGFTRIKNLLLVQQLIHEDPYWSTRVSFPRKWFWLPKNPRWITFHGINIGPQKCIEATVPAIYAIICDEIIWEEPFYMNNPQHRQTALALSNFLNQRIDLHINNFGIEKESGKIVIIDYEHFPTFVGLKDPQPFQGYVQWYSTLIQKMMYDTMGRDKYSRRLLQHSPHKNPFCITQR